VVSDESDAVGRIAEDEAETLVRLLEGKGRKAFVFVAWTEGDTVTLTRSASEGTTTADAQGFVQALDRERCRISSLMGKRADG
jgi:hypothetical protein